MVFFKQEEIQIVAIRRKNIHDVKRLDRHTGVNSKLRKEYGAPSFIPPGEDIDALFEMSADELKEKYPERYKRYVRAIQRKRREQAYNERTVQGKEVNPEWSGEATEEERILDLKWLKMINGLRAMVNRYEGMERVLNKDGVPVFRDPATGEIVQSKKQQFTVDGIIPPQLELRPLQVDAAKAILDHFEQGESKGYSILPTGFGKTILFTKLLQSMDGTGIVVVPTKDLVEQTKNVVQTFAPDFDTKVIVSDAKKAEKGIGENVTIITYASFVNMVRDKKITPEMFDLLILDEAHESTSDPRTNAVEQFLEKSIALGFTATGGYDEKDKHIQNILEHLIFTMTLQEAIDANMLADYQNIAVEFEGVDLANVKMNASGEYDPDELEEAINFRARNKFAAEIYKKHFVGKPTYAFCENITQARAAAIEMNITVLGDEYRPPQLADTVEGESSVDFTADPTMEMLEAINSGDLKIAALPYHSKMPADIQKEVWRLFTEGKIQVLTNVNKCVTGNDYPPATVALNLRPSRSLVAIPQRGGRVLRKFGDKFAYIVDILYKDSRRGRTLTFDEVANEQRLESDNATRLILEQMDEQAEDNKNPYENAKLEEVLDPIPNSEERDSDDVQRRGLNMQLAADAQLPDFNVDLDLAQMPAQNMAENEIQMEEDATLEPANNMNSPFIDSEYDTAPIHNERMDSEYTDISPSRELIQTKYSEATELAERISWVEDIFTVEPGSILIDNLREELARPGVDRDRSLIRSLNQSLRALQEISREAADTYYGIVDKSAFAGASTPIERQAAVEERKQRLQYLEEEAIDHLAAIENLADDMGVEISDAIYVEYDNFFGAALNEESSLASK